VAFSIEFAKYIEGLKLWSDQSKKTGKVFADSRWAWRYENAERRARYSRLAEPLANGLGNALQGLERAVSGFKWPEGFQGLSRGRLAIQDNGLDGYMRSSARSAQESERFYRYFSRGRDPLADDMLDEETYRFRVRVGEEEERLKITVPEGSTWGDVLEKFSDAINESAMPLTADVVEQHNPYQKIEGLGKTGAILSLTLDPAYEDREIELRDEQGVLVRMLDLEPLAEAVRPPETKRYDVVALRDAEASTFRSAAYDPNAATGLSQGTFKIAYSLGGESGLVEVDVESGMTWEELLGRAAVDLDSASERISAQVIDVTMDSGLTEPQTMPGVALKIVARDAKQGERLLLSDYGGPWLEPVKEFFDPSGNLPAEPIQGDRYLASDTANGWTEGRVYEWDGAAWQETSPVEGSALYSSDEDADFFYDGSTWGSEAPDGLLAELGIRTAQPGADAELSVNSHSLTSSTGNFVRDRGRLQLQVEDSFGESLPVRVVEALESLEQGFADAVAAFNGLVEKVENSRDLLKEDFLDDLHDAFENRRTELSWLGLSRLEEDGVLLADREQFYQALGEDPERVKELLLDEDEGLFASWGRLAEWDPEHALLPEVYLQDVSAPSGRVFENEKRSELQQVIDAELDEDSPNRTDAMELEILKSSSNARRQLDFLRGETELDLPGDVFKTKG
jgi:hypothetical protein